MQPPTWRRETIVVPSACTGANRGQRVAFCPVSAIDSPSFDLMYAVDRPHMSWRVDVSKQKPFSSKLGPVHASPGCAFSGHRSSAWHTAFAVPKCDPTMSAT